MALPLTARVIAARSISVSCSWTLRRYKLSSSSSSCKISPLASVIDPVPVSQSLRLDDLPQLQAHCMTRGYVYPSSRHHHPVLPRPTVSFNGLPNLIPLSTKSKSPISSLPNFHSDQDDVERGFHHQYKFESYKASTQQQHCLDQHCKMIRSSETKCPSATAATRVHHVNHTEHKSSSLFSIRMVPITGNPNDFTPNHRDDPPIISFHVPIISFNEPIISHNEPIISFNEPIISFNEPIISHNEPIISFNERVVDMVPGLLCKKFKIGEFRRTIGKPKNPTPKLDYRSVKRWKHLRFVFALEDVDFQSLRAAKRGVIPFTPDHVMHKIKFATFKDQDPELAKQLENPKGNS